MATYTNAAIAAALQASQRVWDFRYDRVTPTGSVVPEYVLSCTIKHNDLADIRRTCEVELDGGTDFDQLTDRLRPYVRLLMPDGDWAEWLMGTFYLQSDHRNRASGPGESASKRVGYDQSQALVDDKMIDRFVAYAAEPYMDVIRNQLEEVGLATNGIVNTSHVLSAPMEWEPGTTRLRVINDLLAAINYRPLDWSPNGNPVARPYVLPSKAPVVWRYSVNSTSVVRPGIDYELDLFSMPNRWIGFVSKPDVPSLRSVVTNDDPQDPLSTVGRGRVISRVIDTTKIGDAPTQELLDAMVARAASDERSQYETVEFSTGIMPIHDAGQVFEVDDGEQLARYRETEWVLPMQVGAAMGHKMRRAVEL